MYDGADRAMKGEVAVPVAEAPAAAEHSAGGASRFAPTARITLIAAGLLFILSAAVGISIGVTWKVTRDNVLEDYISDYNCACAAWARAS